jgi:hypothetical protein
MNHHRLCCCLLGVLALVNSVSAQHRNHDNQKKGSSMRTARWWIGLKTGLNYSEPVVLKSYQVFSSEVPDDPRYAKQYDSRSLNRGYHVGMVAGFAITRNVAILTHPSFIQSTFGYRTRYDWSDSTGQLSIEQAHRLTTSAAEVPVLLRLSWSFRKLQIYGQAGGYYGWLIGASKTVQTRHLETQGESTQTFDGGTQTADMQNGMAPSWKGWIGGGGISYDIDYVRIGLECSFRYGLDNRGNPNHRFTDHRLITSAYDVPDDYRLNNLAFSLVLSMPLDNLIHLKKNSPEPRQKRRLGNPSF